MRMKSLCIAGMLFSLCLPDVFGWDSEYKQGFTLSKSVEHSALIVVGRVIEMEYVYRENVPGRYTTDITVAVEETIKGMPNISKTRVKFIIKGGRGISPTTGKEIEVYNTSEPEFAVGEHILLFLFEGTGSYYENYPYDGLAPYRRDFGKRIIRDDKVGICFVIDDELKYIPMPVDLAVLLIKAADKDKDAMIELENDIKDAIAQHAGSKFTLSQPLIDHLLEEAEEIVERNTENENQDPQPKNEPEDKDQ